jgi:hypothetical protein
MKRIHSERSRIAANAQLTSMGTAGTVSLLASCALSLATDGTARVRTWDLSNWTGLMDCIFMRDVYCMQSGNNKNTLLLQLINKRHGLCFDYGSQVKHANDALSKQNIKMTINSVPSQTDILYNQRSTFLTDTND